MTISPQRRRRKRRKPLPVHLLPTGPPRISRRSDNWFSSTQGCSVERMYELTPPSLQRSKTVSQFKEVVSCFLYLALDTVAGSGGSDKKTQQKFGRILKKLLFVNQAMIADFKSLSFTPQVNLSVKDSKKPVKISVDNIKSLGSIEPGQVLQVQLAMSEGLHEPQKAVYFEIFGKIPFYFQDRHSLLFPAD